MPNQHHPQKVHYTFWIDRFVLQKYKMLAKQQKKGAATLIAETLQAKVENFVLPPEVVEEIEAEIRENQD